MVPVRNFLASSFTQQLQNLCACLVYKPYCFCKSTWLFITYFHHLVLLRVHPFVSQIVYYLSFTSLGLLLLHATKPRSTYSATTLDLFFTSVSAMTTSAMSVVEMESFSNGQLVIIMFLMLLGGEVFTTLLSLFFDRIPKTAQHLRRAKIRVDSVPGVDHINMSEPPSPRSSIFLESNVNDIIRKDSAQSLPPYTDSFIGGDMIRKDSAQSLPPYTVSIISTDMIRKDSAQSLPPYTGSITGGDMIRKDSAQSLPPYTVPEFVPEFVAEELRRHESRMSIDVEHLKLYRSTKFLGLVILTLLLSCHVFGVVFISAYMALIPSARKVLEKKGISRITYAFFLTVSTFSNCGFTPNNENMLAFGMNSGLLLSLIPLTLIGNTFFPSVLRFLVWLLGKLLSKNKDEAEYLLRNEGEVRFYQWVTARHSWLIAGTALGLVSVQFVMFTATAWNSQVLSGMNVYQKLVASVFQSANTRFTGENAVDVTKIDPAIWVLFILMMYLPPRTCFIGTKTDDGSRVRIEEGKKQRGGVIDNFLFSQLSYIVIAIILICMTEREKIQNDPLNFSLLNIVIEVISAYGNVGYSVGYNCDLQINHDANCVNKGYGFSGKWSNGGKWILILVMLFGRLKKYSMDGGKAWKLV